MNYLILGASYTGCYASVNFSKDNHFYFLSRKSSSELIQNNLRPFDLNTSLRDPSKSIDAIIDTIPPILLQENLQRGLVSLAYQKTVESVIENNKKPYPVSYIYLSATSVFPSCEKKNTSLSSQTEIPVFNELSCVAPDTQRGENRYLAEKKILEVYPHAKILRSTGIYGPGRSIVHQFWNGNFGRALLGNLYTSRIHVHDLVRIALALATRERHNTSNEKIPYIVHGVDQETVPYSEVFLFLKNVLKIKVPNDFDFDEAPRGRIIKSLYALELLKGKYTYPSYKEGFLGQN